MAELTNPLHAAAQPSSCCAPEQEASCCSPSDKAECCSPSHGDSCGCAAAATSEPAATEIRHTALQVHQSRSG
jgi:arsenite methyltransferase